MESAVIISGERGNGVLFLLHDERNVCQRSKVGNADSGRPRTSWSNRNYSFYSGG